MNRRELSWGRAALAATALLAAALLMAGCGGGQQAAKLAGKTPGPVATPTVPSSQSGGRSGAGGADGRSAALRHLQAMVVRALRHAGPNAGVLVYDLTAHKTLFTSQAGVARPPASLEKIYTSVALLSLLGPQARLHTDVLGSGHLGPGGVWHGDLFLRGGGDPTFGEAGFVHVWDGGQGALVGTIVDQLRRRGIRQVTGLIYGDGSRFDEQTGGPFTGGQPDIPDYGGEMSALTFDHGATSRKLGPAQFAARQLARSLRAAHVQVKAAPVTRRTPRRARRLATVASPPLAVLLKLMDVPSDDLFADLLTKQLGYRLLHHGTLGAGAVEVRSALAEYGIRPRLHDGSGLDHSDRTTPDQVISLLRQIWGRPLGRMLATALPVVGESGTVQGIGIHTPAQGHCVAKTGTLSRVTNLAGVCTARDAHQLAFAVFLDGPNNAQAFGPLGRIVAAVAGY